MRGKNYKNEQKKVEERSRFTKGPNALCRQSIYSQTHLGLLRTITMC